MKSTLGKAIGPGLMYAGAAIGVSLLVQSTRAGADYGMQMLWLAVLAYLNLRLLTSAFSPPDIRPGLAMLLLARVSLMALMIMAIIFV